MRWVDESVPALGGLTPREAAADPEARDDLVLLLHEMDGDDRGPGGFDPDRLKELLGLGA